MKSHSTMRTGFTSKFRLILVLGGVMWLSDAPHAAPPNPTYAFHIIAYPGARSTTPASINNQGDIVGYYDYDPRGPFHAFLFRHGSYFNIDAPGAFWTAATGINNKG